MDYERAMSVFSKYSRHQDHREYYGMWNSQHNAAGDSEGVGRASDVNGIFGENGEDGILKQCWPQHAEAGPLTGEHTNGFVLLWQIPSYRSVD